MLTTHRKPPQIQRVPTIFDRNDSKIYIGEDAFTFITNIIKQSTVNVMAVNTGVAASFSETFVSLDGNDGFSNEACLDSANFSSVNDMSHINIINENYPLIPIIMISQNSDDKTIENAIGLRVNDYLIKPLNPNQILLSLTKIFRNKELVANKVISNYQNNYQEINDKINYCNSYEDWIEIYKVLIYWELQLGDIQEKEENIFK